MFGIIQKRGADLEIAFSVPKTELVHWRTPKDRSDVSFAHIVINDMLLPPSQAVKWLGYWLTPTIHSSWCNRKLVFGAILPILTYGCNLFVPDAATIKKFNSFWHVVLR